MPTGSIALPQAGSGAAADRPIGDTARVISDKEGSAPSTTVSVLGKTMALFSVRRWHSSRRVMVVVSAALLSMFGSLSLAVAAAPAGASNWAPVHTSDFPDPDVICVPASCAAGATYYAFATQNFAQPGQTVNIQESTSADGVTWTQQNSDALPIVGPWAKPGDTWAPSVAYNGNEHEFVMYYTATEAAAPNDQCIGAATSQSAQGPYVDNSSQPIVCQDGGKVSPTVDNGNFGGSIDPDLFTDASGNAWLIWKSDGNHLTPPISSVIWSVPLGSADFLPTTTTPTSLLVNDQAWQNGIVEGPEMYWGDTTSGSMTPNYYLFFSASLVGSSTYAIGWASCPSGPAAACSDSAANEQSPLLTSQPGMSGPGGPDVFKLPSGQTVMAFAAWQGTTVGYVSCGFRPMYEADLSFDTSNAPPAPVLSDPNPNGPAAASPSCPGPPPPPPGYWQVASDGGIFTFGGAQFYGSTGSIRLNKPVVGMAATPDRRGYWLVASDGGIFAYGDAQFYGSTGSMVLNKPILGMIPTHDGGGYWLIARDGGVFAFGDAPFLGSTGGNAPPYPITAAAPGYINGGYWMVDSNGQVFNFGNAPAEGSPASAPDGYTISGIAPTRDDHGYWLSSWNGNVAGFGDAAGYGSMYGTNLNAPIVGITATRDGAGYWLQGSDGGIFTFGDAPFLGSMGGHHLNAPVVGIATT